MDTFLNIFKPGGRSSRSVVNQVQRLLRGVQRQQEDDSPYSERNRSGERLRVGHAGTLDPLAEGVLVVAVGRATRLIEYAQRGVKEYVATFRLGVTSVTEDIESELVPVTDEVIPDGAVIEAVGAAMRGTIMQRPPVFSAVHVEGKRSYDLARRGVAVELPERPVEIHEFELLNYVYPELRFRLRCGSGTYVRSFGRDLAERLGSGAVMSALMRTSVGVFSVDDAIRLPDTPGSDVEAMRLIEAGRRPLADGLGALPRLTLSELQLHRFHHGQSVALAEITEYVDIPLENMESRNHVEYAVFNTACELISIAAHIGDVLRPVKNLERRE